MSRKDHCIIQKPQVISLYPFIAKHLKNQSRLVQQSPVHLKMYYIIFDNTNGDNQFGGITNQSIHIGLQLFSFRKCINKVVKKMPTCFLKLLFQFIMPPVISTNFSILPKLDIVRFLDFCQSNGYKIISDYALNLRFPYY